MSPEYAMHGKFSVKSDVFSFGVLVLEIISGKKNSGYYRSHDDNELLSFVSFEHVLGLVMSDSAENAWRKSYWNFSCLGVPGFSVYIYIYIYICVYLTKVLAQAWKNWIDQTPFQILDPKLRGSYSRNEVQRCIHIALLCVEENPVERPSMATIMLALNAYSVTLGLPRKPAFFVRGRTTTDRLRHQLDSDHSNSSSVPFSAGDSLITEVYPR